MLSKRNLVTGSALLTFGLFTYYQLQHSKSSNKPIRIAFAVSCSTLEQFKNIDDPIVSHFRKKGFVAEKLAWDDAQANWQDYDVIILYQTWSKDSRLSYYNNKQDYFNWYQRLKEQGKFVVNSFPVVNNYFSKGDYLFRLQAKNINIIPSILLHRHQNYKLKDLLANEGWDNAVLKAAEDDNGLHLYLITQDANCVNQNIFSAESFQEQFNELMKTKSFILQKFIPEIRSVGEISCVFVNGYFNHAVKKITGTNRDEFRTQRIYSKEAAVCHSLSQIQIQAINAIYSTAFSEFNEFEKPLAARIDVVFNSNNHNPVLMEIEAIDPWLYIYEIADTKETLDAFLQQYELALFHKYQLHRNRNSPSGRLSSLMHHHPFLSAMAICSVAKGVAIAHEASVTQYNKFCH